VLERLYEHASWSSAEERSLILDEIEIKLEFCTFRTNVDKTFTKNKKAGNPQLLCTCDFSNPVLQNLDKHQKTQSPLLLSAFNVLVG
jgi:hypothetical protein